MSVYLDRSRLRGRSVVSHFSFLANDHPLHHEHPLLAAFALPLARIRRRRGPMGGSLDASA